MFKSTEFFFNVSSDLYCVLQEYTIIPNLENEFIFFYMAIILS